jgi:hypothetical protein
MSLQDKARTMRDDAEEVTETQATIPPTPKLEGDRRCGGLHADAIVERQLAWALLHYMQQAYPDRPVYVDDGDQVLPGRDLTHAMETIFSVDESIVRCGKGWVHLICGNGVDFISDFGVSPATQRAVHLAEIYVGTRLEDD